MDYSSKIKRMSENMAADYHVALGKKEAAEERLYTAEASKNAYESRENVLREELNVILKAGVKQLEYAADNLSDAATHTMRNVFGPEYTKLKIELDTSSRDSLATILVGKMDEGVEYFAEPYEDNGGGMNDTISTVLKLSALIGYEPDVDNALLADEPSKFVSAEYREGLAKVFRDLSHKTGRQIIMVTHDDNMTMSSDNVIRF